MEKQLKLAAAKIQVNSFSCFPFKKQHSFAYRDLYPRII